MLVLCHSKGLHCKAVKRMLCCPQAVMWLVTGDVRYAANVVNILDAWATTNKRFCGKNAPLVRRTLCKRIWHAAK
jgi:hypothetical protein